MKRFEIEEVPEIAEDGDLAPPCAQDINPEIEPWPGFDPRSLPQADVPLPRAPARVRQTVSAIVREAIEAGLSPHDTYASVSAILIRNNLNVSDAHLSGWVGSHALAVT